MNSNFYWKKKQQKRFIFKYLLPFFFCFFVLLFLHSPHGYTSKRFKGSAGSSHLTIYSLSNPYCHSFIFFLFSLLLQLRHKLHLTYIKALCLSCYNLHFLFGPVIQCFDPAWNWAGLERFATLPSRTRRLQSYLLDT